MESIFKTVADPGFPVGGRRPVGGANLRCIHFSVKMYAKMKEIDPVGGGGGAPATPPWIRQCKIFIDTLSENNRGSDGNMEQ